jgi:DNA-binding response OmpR family regulator
MNSPRKVLLIDNASDRKERIKALADHGYSVFPALRMDEAHSRCTRGAYDLIVVNAGNKREQALEFCDQIRKQCPKQLLLMTSDAAGDRDYAISGGVPALLQRVDELLKDNAKTTDLASAA